MLLLKSSITCNDSSKIIKLIIEKTAKSFKAKSQRKLPFDEHEIRNQLVANYLRDSSALYNQRASNPHTLSR